MKPKSKSKLEHKQNLEKTSIPKAPQIYKKMCAILNQVIGVPSCTTLGIVARYPIRDYNLFFLFIFKFEAWLS